MPATAINNPGAFFIIFDDSGRNYDPMVLLARSGRFMLDGFEFDRNDVGFRDL